MPFMTSRDLAVEIFGNYLEDVFEAIIEGVQNCSDGDHLHLIGLLWLGTTQQVAILREQPFDQFYLHANLVEYSFSQVAAAPLSAPNIR